MNKLQPPWTALSRHYFPFLVTSTICNEDKLEISTNNNFIEQKRTEAIRTCEVLLAFNQRPYSIQFKCLNFKIV